MKRMALRFGELSPRRPGLGRLAITNFENNKTASIDSQACHGKNDKEEFRWCGIELRSARKPASNYELCPKTCVGILGSGWKRGATISVATCSNLETKAPAIGFLSAHIVSSSFWRENDSGLCCPRSKERL